MFKTEFSPKKKKKIVINYFSLVKPSVIESSLKILEGNGRRFKASAQWSASDGTE
jgi:hypothetical protein